MATEREDGMFRTKFTDAEWQTVVFTPLWAFSAVTTVDGTADEREAAVLSKELAEAMLYKDELTREVFGALMSGLATVGAAFAADRRQAIQGLQEAADLLDARLPGGGADKFKLAVLGICINAAKASGPRFRDKVPKEEKTAIALVATALRVPVPRATADWPFRRRPSAASDRGAATDEVAHGPSPSPARPLSIDDLARRRDEAQPVPATGTSPALAASIGNRAHSLHARGEIRIHEVEGIGPSHGEKLTAAGVTTTGHLLERGATSAGRGALAEATGISGALILEWVNHADLMRLDGVGPEYSDLLEAAGVDSLTELAQRNAANLATTLQEVVAARPGMVRRVPIEAQVADWIDQAKTLPKIVTHGRGASTATERPVMEEPAMDGVSAPVTQVTDEVDCSVFAPPACRPGDTAFVQVFAHLPDEAALAASLATEFDEDAVRRAIRSLLAPVARGDTLVFDLSFRDLPVPDPIQTLIWQGRPDSVQFEVPVPGDMRLGTVVGTVGVSLRSIPIGHVKFKLEIANAEREDARPVGDDARRYGRAFISYASLDRAEVVRRVQMLAPLGIRYFQDVLDLEPGERWERMLYSQIDDCDLFLLFWSRAAKQSEWVRKEADYALRRKAGDDFAPPEIRPIILEGPPVEPPWEELAHIHFNDRLVWLIGSDTAPTEIPQ